MSQNPFAERFTKLSDTELLEILHNSKDYDALAVEAARSELDNRDLTHERLKIAERNLNRKMRQKRQIRAIENKVRHYLLQGWEYFNPIQKGPYKVHKYINILSLVLGLIFLYHFIYDFKMMVWMIEDIADCDLSCIAYFVPKIVFPLAIILFWRKKSSGWVLLALFLTYLVFTSFYSLLYALTFVGNSFLDELLPGPSPLTNAARIAFWGGILLFISGKSVREIYKVNIIIMIITISLGATICAMQWWGLILN